MQLPLPPASTPAGAHLAAALLLLAVVVLQASTCGSSRCPAGRWWSRRGLGRDCARCDVNCRAARQGVSRPLTLQQGPTFLDLSTVRGRRMSDNAATDLWHLRRLLAADLRCFWRVMVESAAKMLASSELPTCPSGSLARLGSFPSRLNVNRGQDAQDSVLQVHHGCNASRRIWGSPAQRVPFVILPVGTRNRWQR